MMLSRRCPSLALAFVALSACGDVKDLPDPIDGGGGDDAVDAAGDDDARSPDGGPGAAPDTQIDSGPGALIAVATARLTFSSPDGGAETTYECSLDNAGFAACTSPVDLAGLGDGDHGFRVRALGASGNADPTPAERSWTVDTMAPTATINTGVAEGAATNDVTPAWSFTTAGNPATIECRVENVIYGPCATSYTAPTLPAGNHTFSIHVIDAAGNERTVTRNFAVDTTPPTITLGTVPASPNALSQVTYTWTTSGGVTLTECRPLYQQNVVPAPAFAPCSSPHTTATFNHAGTDVRVRDPAGNLTPAQDTFSHYVVQ